MSLGLYETRARRKRRLRNTFIKWMIGLGLIVGAGVFAYRGGIELAAREVDELERRIETLTASVEGLRDENTRLHAERLIAQQRLEEATKRYDADVPSGDLASFLRRLREKLDSGVDPARLEFLIDSAENARDCDSETASKRFLVQTPLFQGANDSVSFADGRITLSATGEAATDAQGRTESWFDPAQPITLHLTVIGGETSQQIGKLPLHAALVVNETEHRFTVVAGPQGFVQVTADRCRYP